MLRIPRVVSTQVQSKDATRANRFRRPRPDGVVSNALGTASDHRVTSPPTMPVRLPMLARLLRGRGFGPISRDSLMEDRTCLDYLPGRRPGFWGTTPSESGNLSVELGWIDGLWRGGRWPSLRTALWVVGTTPSGSGKIGNSTLKESNLRPWYEEFGDVSVQSNPPSGVDRRWRSAPIRGLSLRRCPSLVPGGQDLRNLGGIFVARVEDDLGSMTKEQSDRSNRVRVLW